MAQYKLPINRLSKVEAEEKEPYVERKVYIAR